MGKTFSCRRHYGGRVHVLRLPEPGDIVRWDGYREGVHEAVLIDEFSGQIPLETLNTWIDVWPFEARTFGGAKEIRPTTFIINSNRPPQQWWGGRQVGSLQFKAFERRYTEAGRLVQCVDRSDVLHLYDEISQLEADDKREDAEAALRVARAQELAAQLDQVEVQLEEFQVPEINWDMPILSPEDEQWLNDL